MPGSAPSRSMVLRVREISNEEGNRLRTAVRHSKDLIEMKRAQVILASAQRFTVQRIAIFSGMSDGYIRILIHSFNDEGLAMLKPRWNPGNRHKFSKETRARLVALATSRPRDLGLPFGPVEPPTAEGHGGGPGHRRIDLSRMAAGHL